MKEVEVVACCDLGRPPEYVMECAGTTAEQFCAEIGCTLIHELELFLELQLDAVMIASEVYQHAEHTLLALDRGWHVFVGKPLSFLPEEVLLVKTSASRVGRIVLPGNPLRYESAMQQTSEKVRSGAVGVPTNMRIFVHHEAMVHQEWERDPAKSGGPLGTFGIYLIDIARWMTGQEFNDVYAMGGQFVFKQIGTWDTVQAMGRMSGGTLVQLNLVSTMTWDFPFVVLDIVGTEGVIRSTYDHYPYLLQTTKGANLGPARYEPMGQKEIEHFIDCCLGRSEPAMTLDDMYAAARGIRAIEQSIVTGQPVDLTITEKRV